MTEAPPTVQEVSRLLAEIGTLLELKGDEGFRARAYARAAKELEASDADLVTLAREERLTELRGIGPGIAAVIREYVLTGESSAYDELRKATPAALYELLRVPGLGTKRIHLLHRKLGIQDLDDLEEAARSGKIAALEGFGARTEAKILAGLAFARSAREQRRYPDALEPAQRLRDWLAEHPSIHEVVIAGGLRRCSEVVDEIVLVTSTDDAASVVDDLRAISGSIRRPSEGRDDVVFRLTDGVSVRIRFSSPSTFIPTLVEETGSEMHVSALRKRAEELGKGWPGEEPGSTRITSEADLYASLDLDLVEPEMREGFGEIDVAAARRLPQLVTLADLRGTFHCHTSYSDGKVSLEEMGVAASARDWEYLGIADHSQTAGYAGGLSVAQLRQQWREIDKLNKRQDQAHLFKGIESDILPSGALDYPDRILAEFDYVVGSVHSSFGMDEETMTRRIVTAIRNPRLTMLGHATGRLLLRREGYPLDLEAVLVAAAEEGVVIEINSNPHRLDLDWRWVRRAVDMGILMAINPDAHSVRALDHVQYGVNMARKAGLEAAQILNTWTLKDVKGFFAKRKQER